MSTFVNLLQATMEVPKMYGAFHIIAFALVISLAAFLIWKFKDAKESSLRKLLFVIWITLVILEIYKQLAFSLIVNEDMTVKWDYQWYIFPFQFCSTPLYLLPILIFAKEGKFRNAIMAYMATFSFFAGLAVMFYPGDVFINYIGINVQTMVHHGMQVVIGAFLVAYNRHHLNKRFFAWSVMVFTAISGVALVMNVVGHHALTYFGINETFNMFYISPYYACSLPVLSVVYEKVSYPIFLILYLLGFSLVSLIVYAAEKGIVKLCSYIKHKA